MRAPAFIVGILAAAIAVGVASALSGAGIWTILARVLGTLFVAQALYVLAVLVLARSGPRQPAPDPEPKPGGANERPPGVSGTPGESS